MLKLLIVDDDEWIREGLNRNIRWQEKGIEVIGTAANGMEGWELAQSLRPDIVLTDIRMPFMDGLMLAEKINGNFPLTKVVFLTGYDDFTYAKKALQLKASDFILKYEENDKILESVAEAGKLLLEERRSLEKSRKSQDLMENQFFCDLLAGASSTEWVEKEAQLLGISFLGRCFRVAVIQTEGVKRFSTPNGPENTELLLFSIKNIGKELFYSKDSGVYFVHYNQRINIVLNVPERAGEQEQSEWVTGVLERVRISVASFLKIPVTIGVGGLFEGYEWLPVSYNEALSAVQMKDVMGGGGIIYSGEIRHSQSSHQTMLKRITDYINAHYHREDMSLAMIAEEVHITPAYVSTLFKKYKEINFMEYLIRVRLDKAKELLANTDLKAYEISEKVGYANAQYFSVLFKKNMGLSPMEYRQKHQA